MSPINVRVSGYIDKIYFEEHQQVKKGDTLLMLQTHELQIQLDNAKSNLLKAKAAISVRKASFKTMENQVALSISSIEQAKARLDFDLSNYRRYKNLLEDKAVTKQQFEQVKTEYLTQKSVYKQMIDQKVSAELSAYENEKSIQVDYAQLEAAEAAVDMAKLNLSYAVITAPYNGVMGRRSINEGQVVQSGQQVASMVQSNKKWITANFLENQMKDISLGDKVDITIDALGGKLYKGTVSAISGATGAKYAAIPLDNSVGNFVKVQSRIPVRIEFTNENQQKDLDKLIAGMNVVVKRSK
ncbi:HlyD family secretion protein [Sphingobacterium sp. N143]|uniref:HlyD family secretion protein n=1 Tax=Sphingobacterium sp. N143 TaxID=2746727 RepID=UPI00257710CF|nr:HlyD family secretion protein [Sphingobacterium sp. N143]